MGTRITFRYKNDDKPEVLPTHSKAIRCWEEGFCIAVYEPESNQVVVVEEHLFEEDYPMKGKMHLLSEAEKQWPTGGEMRLVCFNHPNTQIPQHLYNEADKNLYLQLLTATPYRFTPVEELVEPLGLYNLSGWDKNLYHEIMLLHPECRLQSGMYLLLQLLARQEGRRKIVAFVERNHLDIVAADNDRLLGSNSFPFNSPNDFLYCFAGFARTLFGDTDAIDVHLGGEVEKDSQIYISIQKYFPSVQFIDNGFQTLRQDQHRYCDLLFQ